MAKITVNGRSLEAAEGRLVIDVAREAGISIPHYCYHPALGNPGNCRLCVVEVEGAPKPQVSCRLPVKDGMVVKTDSEAARRAQSSSVELHLVNHPLDCPVCDQAGECALQDYYMQVGRYQSSVREDKIHKAKRVPVGEHVMLDQERCILCTRCTRFTEKVTGTSELGVFGRGHREVVDLAPGKTLDNAYSGNVVDLCPVGALTDRDFRYKVRVWYMEEAESVCAGCSRVCAVDIHSNTKRPWHNDGRRIARVKPRHDPEVNGYWMCDEGRYGFGPYDEARLGKVLRLKPHREELSWDAAFDAVAGALRDGARDKGAEGLAVVASGALSNEDWAALKSFFADAMGARRFLFTPEPEQLGEEDGLLRRREKVPNLRGGMALGFGSRIAALSWENLASDIEAGKVWGLYVIDRDAAKVWGARTESLFSRLDLLVYQGWRKDSTSTAAHYRLPATAHIEEDGHFTNFEGKIRKYHAALPAVGQALPDWRIFNGLLNSMDVLSRDAREGSHFFKGVAPS